jgi:hypothetical protein
MYVSRAARAGDAREREQLVACVHARTGLGASLLFFSSAYMIRLQQARRPCTPRAARLLSTLCARALAQSHSARNQSRAGSRATRMSVSLYCSFSSLVLVYFVDPQPAPSQGCARVL